MIFISQSVNNLVCFLVFSHSYCNKTSQNSLHCIHIVPRAVPQTFTMTVIPGTFEAEVIIGWMSFLSNPIKQRRRSEDKKSPKWLTRLHNDNLLDDTTSGSRLFHVLVVKNHFPFPCICGLSGVSTITKLSISDSERRVVHKSCDDSWRRLSAGNPWYDHRPTGARPPSYWRRSYGDSYETSRSGLQIVLRSVGRNYLIS